MNKVILMGRLTKDPASKSTTIGNIVSNFTLAVNRRFSKETDFINCVAWNKAAELVEAYCKKGQRIAVVGSLQVRSWDGEDGKRRYATEVVVEELHFADTKKEKETVDEYPPEESVEDLPF